MVGKEQHNPKSNETLEAQEVSKEQLESIKNDLESRSERAEADGKESLDKARKTIESEAVSGNETRLGSVEKESPKQSVTRAEKTRSYKTTMSRAQSQLPAISKGFSKFIHNPVVEKTSDAIGSTIARPSGLLGAGIFGFVGFSIVVYYAKRNGFTINDDSSLIVILLVVGWLVGVLFELASKALKKSRKLK